MSPAVYKVVDELLDAVRVGILGQLQLQMTDETDGDGCAILYHIA